MKKSDLLQTYNIPYQGGVSKVEVTLGDTIWWFPEGQTHNVPMVATVTRLGEGMLTLRYNHDSGPTARTIVGVVPIGDVRLTNKNVSAKGAWCTRAFWDLLQITGE
jgi:hypothetical protein